MNNLPSPFQLPDDDAQKNLSVEYSSTRFVLPVAAMGLIISFGLFWMMQLFGQWYVSSQLADATHKLIMQEQEQAQKQLGLMKQIQNSMKFEYWRHSGDIQKIFEDQADNIPYLSFYILEKDRVIRLGRRSENADIPIALEEWKAIITSGKYLNEKILVSDFPRDGKSKRSYIIFSERSISNHDTREIPQVFAVLNAQLFLDDVKSVVSGSSLDELVLYTPDETKQLARVEDHKNNGGFSALIHGDIPLYLGDITFALQFGASPGKFILWVIILPYVALLTGLLVTFLIGYNLWNTDQRGNEVNALAQSLTKTVSELEQRIVEGELMAAALRESERKYRAIFENASIGICQI